MTRQTRCGSRFSIWACTLAFSGLTPHTAASAGDLYRVVEIPAGSMEYDVPISSYMGVAYVNVRIDIAKPYRIGEYEVTVGQWNLCVQDGWCPSRPGLEKPALQDHPMVKVTWHDAYRFALWISKKTGRRYRLPTEHEWFFAANEGKYRKEQSPTYSYANIESIRKIPKITYPIGTFGANAWGVYDTAGNVWEWTLACYALAEERLRGPQRAAELNDPQRCVTRITGGEHRAHVPDFIADTYNGGCATLKPAANLGFRLVLENDPEE
ncbi:MAG: SUMF1/EgtB/PvdO family nonheme iron enzyme [Gemmatimonadetes bacterium]|nr:SUMF1/EgtB/PvdO family nonheme iron enzyme [Gemmatimonadota bacterium]